MDGCASPLQGCALKRTQNGYFSLHFLVTNAFRLQQKTGLYLHSANSSLLSSQTKPQTCIPSNSGTEKLWVWFYFLREANLHRIAVLFSLYQTQMISLKGKENSLQVNESIHTQMSYSSALATCGNGNLIMPQDQYPIC